MDCNLEFNMLKMFSVSINCGHQSSFKVTPAWALVTRDFLNQSLPNKWIGRALDEDAALIHWPPRSPDLTPLDFYLWGFIKTKVYTSPMPKNLTQLRQRIKSVIEEITPANLKRVWGNLERRLVITIERKGKQFVHIIY